MVRISPSVTLELKSGQTITIDIEEARQISRSLAKFVQDVNSHAAKARVKKGRGNAMKGAATIPHMSEAKKNEILKHVNKKVSRRPRTLSSLLKGVSYVPNHLPSIRKIVEAQQNISKEQKGKRTFYYRK
jgi:hypothetical protein